MSLHNPTSSLVTFPPGFFRNSGTLSTPSVSLFSLSLIAFLISFSSECGFLLSIYASFSFSRLISPYYRFPFPIMQYFNMFLLSNSLSFLIIQFLSLALVFVLSEPPFPHCASGQTFPTCQPLVPNTTHATILLFICPFSSELLFNLSTFLHVHILLLSSFIYHLKHFLRHP